MKNISRRVFIKGMAVAAVATAASTVLAGCNVPGIVEETPVAGFSPITKTLTFADKKTADVTVKGVSNLYNDAVKLELSFNNKTGRTLAFYTANNKGDGYVNVTVKAYFDGEYSAQDAVSGVDSVMFSDAGRYDCDVEDKTTGETKTYTYEGNLYFAGKKDWKTMTLVLTYVNDKNETKEAQYVINK